LPYGGLAGEVPSGQRPCPLPRLWWTKPDLYVCLRLDRPTSFWNVRFALEFPASWSKRTRRSRTIRGWWATMWDSWRKQRFLSELDYSCIKFSSPVSVLVTWRFSIFILAQSMTFAKFARRQNTHVERRHNITVALPLCGVPCQPTRLLRGPLLCLLIDLHQPLGRGWVAIVRLKPRDLRRLQEALGVVEER